MSAENVTLLDVVEDLEGQDGELTIYASRPFTSDSRVVMAKEPNGGGAPPEAKTQGAEYFLDVLAAREFLEGAVETEGTSPLRDQCVRLIGFALTDGWIPQKLESRGYGRARFVARRLTVPATVERLQRHEPLRGNQRAI